MAAQTLTTRGFAVLRDGDAVPDRLRHAVTAVGNFDGVHLGHARLISTAVERAARTGTPAAALTFEPHPRAYFTPDAPHFRLTPERAKLKVLSRLGLDAAFVRRFDQALASTSAEDFVVDLLGRDLAASALVVGSDFHFGHGRQGTPALLAELGRASGIGVTLVETVEVDGAPVSSSRIRNALRDGDIGGANRLLGYRWFVQGEVVHGAKRGRELGFPTANLILEEGCGLRHGVYAVRAAIGRAEMRNGVASFGRRPTFDNGAPLLETYLLDFSGDLYGRLVEIEFVAFLRAEERFGSAETLVEAMKADEDRARQALREVAATSAPSLIG